MKIHKFLYYLYIHVQSVKTYNIMFITIEHIKNIGNSKFGNTERLLGQVRNLFINFELKVST